MARQTTLFSVLLLLTTLALLTALIPTATVADQQSAAVDDYTVTRGDTVNITVSHSAPANVTIGGPAQRFEVNVSLDGSGDDTIKLDTYRTTSRNTNQFLDPKGRLLTPENRALPKALYPGRYTIEVRINGSIQAGGNLYVEPRKELVADTRRLPNTADLDDITIGDGSTDLTKANNVTLGDYAVFTVNESGLEGAFTDEINATELRTQEGIEFEIERSEPLPNELPDHYSNRDLYVQSQVKNSNQFYVVWDTSSANLRANWNNTYNLKITLNANESPLVSADKKILEQPVTVQYPEIRLSSSPGFTLQPWEKPELDVTGQTNIAPGTDITIKALQREPNLDVWTSNATIDNSGRFSTTLNFTDADRPSQFPLWIENYRPRSTYRLNLPAASNGSYMFPSQTVVDGHVSVINASFSHGGFIQLQENNTTLGVSSYLSSGTHEEVSIPVRKQLQKPINVTAVALADGNDNGEYDSTDPPVRRNRTEVTDTAVISPSRSTTTPSSPNETTATTARDLNIENSPPLTPSSTSSSGGTVPHSPLIPIIALFLAVLVAAIPH